MLFKYTYATREWFLKLICLHPPNLQKSHNSECTSIIYYVQWYAKYSTVKVGVEWLLYTVNRYVWNLLPCKPYYVTKDSTRVFETHLGCQMYINDLLNRWLVFWLYWGFFTDHLFYNLLLFNAAMWHTHREWRIPLEFFSGNLSLLAGIGIKAKWSW